MASNREEEKRRREKGYVPETQLIRPVQKHASRGGTRRYDVD